jgi:hypothetical protein
MSKLSKWRNAVTRLIGRIAAIMLCLAMPATFAGGADLNVYSTTAMRGVLEELVPQFQKQSGSIRRREATRQRSLPPARPSLPFSRNPRS